MSESYYGFTVTTDAAWQSGVAIAFLAFMTMSSIVVGKLSKGRFSLILPTIRKWQALVDGDNGYEENNKCESQSGKHMLIPGDKVVARNSVGIQAERWTAGQVEFTVGGIARIIFEGTDGYIERDLTAAEIRYAPTRESKWSFSQDGDMGEDGLPEDAEEVWIPLDDDDDQLANGNNDEETGSSTKANTTGNDRNLANKMTSTVNAICPSLFQKVFVMYFTQYMCYATIGLVLGGLIYMDIYITVGNTTVTTTIFFVGATLFSGILSSSVRTSAAGSLTIRCTTFLA